MYVPELIDLDQGFPGMGANVQSRNVRALVDTFEPVVIEAAIALDLFNQARTYRDALAPDFWWIDEPEKRAALANVAVPTDRPKIYFKQAVHLHARTFVLSIRMIGVLLETLAEEAGDPEIDLEAQAFASQFPKLRELRNSISHMEDRVRGLREKKKPIVLQSVPFLAEGGGVLFTDLLRSDRSGTRLIWTIADGSVGDCAISEEVLRLAVQHVNRALAVLASTRTLENG